jgi:putative membrane protein
MNKLIPVIAAVALSSGAAWAQTSMPSPAAGAMQASQATISFVQKAEAGSQFEIQTGQLAEQQASSPKVKQFGKMMVKDHGAAAKQLKATLAKDKHAGLPADTPMNSEQTSNYDQLKGLHGSDFDKTYVQIMLKDHQEDAKVFQDYAKTGDDPSIKSFAAKTAKVIEKHLKHVQELQNNMQKSALR